MVVVSFFGSTKKYSLFYRLLRQNYLDFSYFLVIFELVEVFWKTIPPLKLIRR